MIDVIEFAGPCAQGVLDTVIVPCPMSLGCAVLIGPIVYSEIMQWIGGVRSTHRPLSHVQGHEPVQNQEF